MGSPRARLGLGVRDRGGDGLLYSPPRLFSARNAQYTHGPSSLYDPLYVWTLSIHTETGFKSGFNANCNLA